MAQVMMNHEDAKEWLMCEDEVISTQAGSAVGSEGMITLAEAYKEEGALFEAAKVIWAMVCRVSTAHRSEMQEIMSLLDQSETTELHTSTKATQLQLDVVTAYRFQHVQDLEGKERANAKLALLEQKDGLRIDFWSSLSFFESMALKIVNKLRLC